MKSKIIFNSKSHTYTSGKKIQYSSVSSLIGKYKQPYNAEYWSLYKAYERVLGDKFKDLKRGYKLQDSSLFKHLRNFADEQKVLKTQLEILQEWKGEKDKSIIKGNEYHTFKENQAISSGVCLNPFSDCNYPTVESTKITVKNKVEYREPTVDELYDLVDGFHPELILWNNDYKLAGQADKVFIETINGVRYAEIDDYKTNKAIKKANFFGKMLDPLGHLDCCVSGDTKLITEDGIVKIKDTLDIPIKIWNGNVWSEVIPFKTKSNTTLYRVLFDDGSYLDVTDNHKFLIKYRLDKDFIEQTTEDIINKMNTTKWLPRVPNSNIKYIEKGIEVLEAYDYGFLLGDGTVGKWKSEIKAELYNKDKQIKFVTGEKRNYSNHIIQYFDLDYKFSKDLKYDYGLPNIIFSWDKKSILNFISGWIDADGTNQHGKIRLYGKEDKIRDAQLLLTKCGIKSSIKIAGYKDDITSVSKRKSDLYYLSISKTSELNTQRVISNSNNESTKKHKWQFIKSITKLEDLQDSFCLTEKLNNQCVFNNVLTKQCNYNHYRLQISTYAWMLEQAGYTIRNTAFTHLNQQYKFDYMKHEVQLMLDIDPYLKLI